MSVEPQLRFDAEAYIAWASEQDRRYELVDGLVVAQAAERAAHAEMKFAMARALLDAIQKSGLPCHVLPDGMAVKLDNATVFEPDALVYRGPKLHPDALLLENLLIVVEVLSPSSGRNDALHKLVGYFRLPSVQHYLIVDPDEPLVIHHQRMDGGKTMAAVLRGGAIQLDPPGLSVNISQIYGAPA